MLVCASMMQLQLSWSLRSLRIEDYKFDSEILALLHKTFYVKTTLASFLRIILWKKKKKKRCTRHRF